VLAKAVLSLGGGERFYLHDEGKPDGPTAFWLTWSQALRAGTRRVGSRLCASGAPKSDFQR